MNAYHLLSIARDARLAGRDAEHAAVLDEVGVDVAHRRLVGKRTIGRPYFYRDEPDEYEAGTEDAIAGYSDEEIAAMHAVTRIEKNREWRRIDWFDWKQIQPSTLSTVAEIYRRVYSEAFVGQLTQQAGPRVGMFARMVVESEDAKRRLREGLERDLFGRASETRILDTRFLGLSALYDPDPA